MKPRVRTINRFLQIVALLPFGALPAIAHGQSNYNDFANACRSNGGVPYPSPAKCVFPPKPAYTPRPTYNQPASSTPTPSGPTPEELRKRADDAAAAAEAQKRAAFIRDRDSTDLRDAVGSGTSGGIRDDTGGSGGIRDADGPQPGSGGIRDSTTSTHSPTLDQLKRMAGESGDSADVQCRFDKGGCPTVDVVLIPRILMSQRTLELLKHIPLAAQSKPGVINKINDYDRAEKVRSKNGRAADALQKKIAAGSVVDVADAKRDAATFTAKAAKASTTEAQIAADLKGDPEVGWDEGPPAATAHH
jgi:hypothetical protein